MISVVLMTINTFAILKKYFEHIFYNVFKNF